MADPTSVLNVTYEIDVNRSTHIIKNSEALVRNALASVAWDTNYVEFADDAANLIPAGLVERPYDGINDHLTGNTTNGYKAICIGGIVARWSVTGASAATDNGKLVYATDGQTLTLTRPTTGLPHGFVIRWDTSTYCYVYFFSYAESCKMFYSGMHDIQIKDFGTFPTNGLQGTAALTLWQETAYDHYKFISLHAQGVAFDNAAVAGSQVLNLDIGGTNTTGGALTVAYTDVDAAGDMGVAIDATAITAANEVHMGDTVKLEMAASGTGFSADCAAAIKVYAVIQKLPGA